MADDINIDPVYRGEPRRDPGGRVVTRDGAILPLAPSQALWNHSPDGFNWGYGGSGPAQLALALLLDTVGSLDAVPLHQTFKAQVVSGWPGASAWQITGSELAAWWAAQIGAAELAKRERARCNALGWIDRNIQVLLSILENPEPPHLQILQAFVIGLQECAEALRYGADELPPDVR